MHNLLSKCLTVLLALLFLLPPVCMAAPLQRPIEGLIDIEEHWARQPIEKIYAIGLINGYPDNTFQPNQQVSCLEAVTIILNSGGYGGQIAKIKRAKNAPPSTYPVPWGQNYMDFAVEHKFIPQTILENFQYDRTISRVEVAAILAKVFGLSDQGTAVNFTDSKNIPSEYLAAVQAVNENKIMLGYPDGCFQPQNPILRSEMAAMLAHAYDLDWVNDDSKRKIKGWVSGVIPVKNQLKVEISSLNGTVNVTTDPGCPCYYQGERVNITRSVDYRVTGILNTNKKIMYLELLEKRNFTSIKSNIYASFNNLAQGEPVIMTIKDLLNDKVSYPVAWDTTTIDEKSKTRNKPAIDMYKQLKADQFLKIGLTADKIIKSVTILDIKTVSGTVESVGKYLNLVHKVSSSSNSQTNNKNYKPTSFLYWDWGRLVDKDGNNTDIKTGDMVIISYIGEPLYENILEIKVQSTRK